MDYLLKYLLVALAFFGPIYPIMLLIGMVVITDTIMGRWCAKRLAKKEGKDVRLEVTSRKTRLGFISKTLAYQAAIIFTFILDSYFLGDLIQYFVPEFPITFVVTKLLGVILILIEFDSIDEKYYKVTGKRMKNIIKEKIKKLKNLILGGKDVKDELEK